MDDRSPFDGHAAGIAAHAIGQFGRFLDVPYREISLFADLEGFPTGLACPVPWQH